MCKKSENIARHCFLCVAAPNKPMVQKLVSLLGQSLEGVAPSGIVWEKDTPKDLLTQRLETKGGCHSLLSHHLQTVGAACERIQHQVAMIRFQVSRHCISCDSWIKVSRVELKVICILDHWSWNLISSWLEI